MPIPEGLSPPASTGGAAQTKSQAGVTGNACCLVGEGGEGNYNYKKPLFSAAWYMSQALSVSKGELVLVVVVAERGVGLVHKAKSYKLFLLARSLIIGYYHLHCFFFTSCDMVDARFLPSILYDVI